MVAFKARYGGFSSRNSVCPMFALGGPESETPPGLKALEGDLDDGCDAIWAVGEGDLLASLLYRDLATEEATTRQDRRAEQKEG